MLKDEPKLLYIYECIKLDKDDPIKKVTKKEGVTNITSQHQLGEVFNTLTNDLDEEFYKPIGTYRRAFVGDMQEKIDAAMQRNMMEYYAKNCGRYTEHIWHTVKIEVRVNIFKQFVEWIRDSIKDRKFMTYQKRQKKEDSMWLEEQLFGPKL